MEKDFQMPAFLPPEQGSSDGITLDYKRIIYQARKYWYLIAVSVLSTVTIAFLLNRYSPRIYPITASVIVKEAEEFTGGELIYNNPLINFRRNYLNEIYILKSYPLMQRVIEDLNYDVSFLRQGNVLTTEVFDDDFPVAGFADRSKTSKPVSFIFTLIDENKYTLEPLNEEEAGEVPSFRFGDTINYCGFSGVIRLSDRLGASRIKNERIVFNYTPSILMADKYVNSVKASWAEEGAGVVLLSLEGKSPRKEINFLNALIAHYQNNDLENKNETASRTVSFISDQLNGIRDSLRQVEWELERFKDKNVITDLNGEALRLYTKIEELETQKAQMLVGQNYYNYLIDYIKNNQNLHQIILPSSVGISDPILTNLITQMTEIQMDIKMYGKAENPLVTESIRRINEIKKDIVESIENQESTDKIRINFLNGQIRDIEKQLSYLPVAQRNYVSIQRNYTLLENLYIFLLQKRSEAAISQASNTSDIALVNPAKAGLPISPRAGRNYILALAIGLFLPMVVFIMIELLDTKVQSKEDIEKITRIPFIGGVGHKKIKNNLAVFHQPKSALAESFRALRSNLSYFVKDREKSSIFLITSSISGEGKSFTSMNLAGVLSLSGKRTLIIGADLRKPKIFSDFDLSNDIGLSSYLAGMAEHDKIIFKTTYPNLDVVPGGPIPPNPSELLLSERMAEFLNYAKTIYHYIVIDTPPVAVVTDAFVLAKYSDHIIFLVRQNYTPKSLLKTADESYAAGKLENVSIVLNDIYKSGPGYGYGYSYGYGYGYGYNNSNAEYYTEG